MTRPRAPIDAPLTRIQTIPAIAAGWLPGDCHRDPADRLLIATARYLNIPIVTRDSGIAAYAAQGLVGLIRC